ncbi:helix-hairpin-helix domain-containing protein [Paenarthrobacter nicotinovorans]|uniref:helix-hairpin-helix domain-containing protein n=1 Tax=Paenarthrobacter nicotinovorans TaxID=29320 RepID=UPI003DA5520A
MPRRSRDLSPDAAAQAARERFAARMIPDHSSRPLLDLSGDSGAETDDLASLFAGEANSVPAVARLRWRTSWRVAALVAVVAAVLMAWFLWRLADGRATSEPLGPSVSAGRSDGPDAVDPPAEGVQPAEVAAPPAQGGPGVVMLHVAGAVGKPGVVSLPQGSRVFQAIDAAGGAAPGADLTALNLAEVLTDGIKVYIPVVGETPPQSSPVAGAGAVSGAASGTAGPATTGAKVNINTASLEELGTLPRVGPVTAQRILDWRKEHGAFTSVDELDAVDGIGPKLMESLKDLVTVQGG